MRCFYPKEGNPCGRCPACLLNKQRAFAFRLEQEQKSASYTIWATFTYSDEFLPISSRGDPCVSREDCRRLFDNIRKAFPSIKCKHFLSSEYGPKTFRPHYHCLFFCYDSSPENEYPKNYKDLIEYIQTKAWNRGFVCIKPLNMNVYKYVAKYCCKPELVGFIPTVKPFQMISQGMGISLLYQLEWDKMIEAGDFTVASSQGKRIELPRYYKQKILPSTRPKLNSDGTINLDEYKQFWRNKKYWKQYNDKYSERNFKREESERMNHDIKRPKELGWYQYRESLKNQSVNSFINNLQKRNNL